MFLSGSYKILKFISLKTVFYPEIVFGAERKEKIDTTPSNNKGQVKKKENIFYFITNDPG